MPDDDRSTHRSRYRGATYGRSSGAVGAQPEQPGRQEAAIAIPEGKVAIIVDAVLVQRLGLGLAVERGVTEAEADALFERSLYRKELSEKTRSRYRSCWH